MKTVRIVIEEWLKERGAQQKQLAHAWQERVGSGEVSTYETRISKLMNDEDEGYDFLLKAKSTERLEGLAACLGLPTEELATICRAARSCRTLVLDPRLPHPQKNFFETRAGLSAGAFRASAPNGEFAPQPPREAMKSLAQQARNPLVVLQNERDRDFFEGAGLTTSTVIERHPGFSLVAQPDWFPMLPIRLHDDDGTPMLPDTDMEARYRQQIGQSEQRRSFGAFQAQAPTSRYEPWTSAIERADTEGRPVTFRLDHLLESWRTAPKPTLLKEALLAQGLPQEGARETPTGFLWLAGERVSAIGPSPERAKVEQHHPVLEVATFGTLVEAIRKVTPTLNPNGSGDSVSFEAELNALENEVGIRVHLNTDDLRHVLQSRRSAGELKSVASSRKDSDADQRVLRILDDLLDREWLASPETIFELEILRSASLVHTTSPEWNVLLANVGAGNVLRFFYQEFSREPPTAIHQWQSVRGDRWLEAGNLRFTTQLSRRDSLEGSVLRAGARRRAAEQAAAEDARDD